MTISERIFAIMSEKKLKQKDLAEYTGISTSAVSDWRKKGTNPSVDKIIKICEFLNVSSHYLLTGEDTDNFIDKKVLSAFHQLNEDNQDIIIGKIKELLKEQKYDESVAADNKFN